MATLNLKQPYLLEQETEDVMTQLGSKVQTRN